MPALSTMAKDSAASGKRGRSPRMLVLAPTRELAMQSQAVLEEFGGAVRLTSTVIYGGVPKPAQKDVLRKGVDCVVCTPGRLKDLINEGAVDLSDIRHLVLDEADRMLGESTTICSHVVGHLGCVCAFSCWGFSQHSSFCTSVTAKIDAG